ncbi:hypothetical protein VCHA53O466_140098 [Vibrio chagasii]|nr:hypothetical protein VCHA53O466_140098 [Vibrio chagasii]
MPLHASSTLSKLETLSLIPFFGKPAFWYLTVHDQLVFRAEIRRIINKEQSGITPKSRARLESKLSSKDKEKKLYNDYEAKVIAEAIFYSEQENEVSHVVDGYNGNESIPADFFAAYKQIQNERSVLFSRWNNECTQRENLEKSHKELKKERDRFRKWWHEEVNELSKSKKEAETLSGKVAQLEAKLRNKSSNHGYSNQTHDEPSMDSASARDILGLSGSFDLHTLKKRYRTLSGIYHPDKGGNDFMMQKVNNAYNKLKASAR